MKRFSVDGEYKRFAFTETGISPRTIPGTRGGIFWMSGDEHDELGHIDESAANRVKMHDKRMRKLELVGREIPEKELIRFFGDPDADFTIVSWGSPKGPILDAMPRLKQEGINVNFLQVHVLWPFPVESVTRILKKAKKIIDVEMNYSGQFASLVRRETGIQVHHKVLKWNGRPISETEVFDAIREIAKKNAERVALTAGM